MPVAETISVGTELLLGDLIDSNSAEVGRLLATLGIGHYHRQTVGDNLERLTSAIKLALQRADIVFLIGGLGPTQDDLTRDGLAAAFDDHLVMDNDAKKRLLALFRIRGISPTENQLRQATRPSLARTVPNENGTAPGIVLQQSGKTVFCLPGPPNEFIPMLHGPVNDVLKELTDDHTIVSRTLRIVGVGEGALEDGIKDLLQDSDVTVAPYAKTGEVHLRLTTRAQNRGDGLERIQPVAQEVYRRFPKAVYAEGDESLAVWIINRLKSEGQALAVAESCTGGLLGAELTSVDGASSVFLGGFLTYSAEMKAQMVGVSHAALYQPEFGPVSERCAREMADGAKSATNADWGVSITGVAGSADIEENGVTKPRGLVFIAVSGPTETVVQKEEFRGSRQTIRSRAVAWALAALRREILTQIAEPE